MPLAGALAVTAFLVALGVGIALGGADGDHAPATRAAKRQALLMPAGSNPFRVRGSGFRARERVRVTITPTGGSGIMRRVRANARGTFTVAFARVDSCGGVHGVAAGSRGSRASFQFSAIMC
jgi:hypothetical protein